jgi:hypothetical protein
MACGLPRQWTHRQITFATLNEARKFPQRAFYKPADDKTFLAQIYNGGHELPTEGLPNDLPVLVSEIVSWAIEFRCFILDGKLKTLSPYLRRHQRIETDEGDFPATDEEFADATRFINRFLAEQAQTLPPAVVVDVGLCQTESLPPTWAVIEANTAWGAGI